MDLVGSLNTSLRICGDFKDKVNKVSQQNLHYKLFILSNGVHTELNYYGGWKWEYRSWMPMLPERTSWNACEMHQVIRDWIKLIVCISFLKFMFKLKIQERLNYP